MNTNQIKSNNNPIARIHPLVAVAAASVIVVSLLGAAAMTGMLPNAHATVPATLASGEQAQAQESVSAAATHKSTSHHAPVKQPSTQQTAASDSPVQSPAPQHQAQAAPAKQNSPLGIGIGAAVGGLIGNQFGSGDGKTLATIAGAVGGGYVGNEIAKKQTP